MLQNIFPKNIIETIRIRLYTFFKIPLINYTKPRVINLDDTRCEVVIPHNRGNKNHVNSIYFGALAVGADLCVGLLALSQIEKSKKKIVLIFKDFNADFLKLAKSDAHFICDEGKKIGELVDKVIATRSRQNATIKGYAICPKASGDEVVARFSLTLSLK